MMALRNQENVDPWGIMPQKFTVERVYQIISTGLLEISSYKFE